MRKLFGWMAGLVGIAALARVLSTRRARVEGRAPARTTPEVDPAVELRRKLSEARAEPAVGSPPRTPPAEPAETLDQRRARVHAKAQEAMDEMEALQEPPT